MKENGFIPSSLLPARQKIDVVNIISLKSGGEKLVTEKEVIVIGSSFDAAKGIEKDEE